jgi:hypothetical protein
MEEDEHLRHELGNALAIAIANVEGMVDGVVTPTVDRLEGVAEALRGAMRLLDRMRRDT